MNNWHIGVSIVIILQIPYIISDIMLIDSIIILKIDAHLKIVFEFSDQFLFVEHVKDVHNQDFFISCTLPQM